MQCGGASGTPLGFRTAPLVPYAVLGSQAGKLRLLSSGEAVASPALQKHLGSWRWLQRLPVSSCEAGL